MLETYPKMDNLIFKEYNRALQNKISLKIMVRLYKKSKKCKNLL